MSDTARPVSNLTLAAVRRWSTETDPDGLIARLVATVDAARAETAAAWEAERRQYERLRAEERAHDATRQRSGADPSPA